MTWIKTNPLSEGEEALQRAVEGQRSLYPIEYAQPVHPTGDGTSEIVASHSLIPDALYHAFATLRRADGRRRRVRSRAIRDHRGICCGVAPTHF